MANLNVDPEYLESLAKYQDDAAEKSASGAAVTNRIPFNLWMTHGVISGLTNNSASGLVSQRRAAGAALANATAQLAKDLRAGGKAYATVDEKLGENLDSQVLPK